MKPAIVLVALMALAPIGSVAQSTLDRDIALDRARVVQLDTDSGDVVLLPGSGDDVHVHVVSTSRTNTVVVKVSSERRGNRLIVTLHGPQQNVLPFSSGSSQRYEVRVPAGVKVDVRSYSGSLSADDLNAQLTFSLARGDVTLHSPRAQVTGSDDEGSIAVTAAASGLDLLATRGAIDATLAPGWHGTTLRMQSEQGNLTLTVPKGLRAHVDATTGDGSVQNALHGSGGQLLFLFARSGNVTVRESDV